MTPLFPYQDVGVDFITARDRAGLHDVMGLGKTAQIVTAADKINAQRGIVIVPAKLRRNTAKQFKMWSDRGYKLTEGRTVHDFIAWTRGRYQIICTSYEQATKWAGSIYNSGEPIDFIAMDEAHYLKNSDAARTKAILGPNYDGDNALITWAEHVWHVTGTLMTNDPIDIYTFLKMCRATPLTLGQFTQRYFYSATSTYGSRQTLRPEPGLKAELDLLLNNWRIRRTLDDVGIQLPSIRLDPYAIDGDNTQIVALLKQYPGLDRAIIAALDSGQGLSFLDSQHIMTLRRLLGEAKSVPYAHTLFREMQSNGFEKHVTMGVHISALTHVHNYMNRALAPLGLRSVLVNGQISDRVADDRVQEFQDDPRCVHFTGNIKAAGLGNTITAANRLDMLESEWSPGPNAQAIKRIHRIGQNRPCFIRFVSLANTFDENVSDIVRGKAGAIAGIDGDAMHAMA